MKRKLRVVLLVEVADLADSDRTELASEMMDDPDPDKGIGLSGDDLPAMGDYADKPEEIAEVLAEGISPEMTAEFFAGTNIYVGFASATYESAEWVGEEYPGDLEPMHDTEIAF